MIVGWVVGNDATLTDTVSAALADPSDPSDLAGPDEAPADRRVGGRPVSWVLLAVPPLILAFGGWQYRWMADDGFINVRVAQQITAGNGPVFNAGERVEVGTSVLWVWLLAALRGALGWAVATEWLAVLAGLGLSVLGLVAAELGAVDLATTYRRGRPDAARPPLLVPLGALAVACLAPFWEFATSGLETGLTFGWLGVSFWLVAHHAVAAPPGRNRPSALRPWGALIVLGLGPLVRPELAIFSLAFLAAWFLASRLTLRSTLAGLALASAVPLAYQVFRMGYFATAVPNTALAKEAGTANWTQGLAYLDNFVFPYYLWIPLAAAAVVALVGPGRSVGHRQGRYPWPNARGDAALAPLTMGAAAVSVLYVVRVGGDFMHARMFLPALFGFLLPVAVVPLARDDSLAGGIRWVGAVVLGAWIVLAGASLRPPGDATLPRSQLGIVDERMVWRAFSHRSTPITIGDFRETAQWNFGDGARQKQEAGVPALMVTKRMMDEPVPPGAPTGGEVGNIGIFGVAAGIDVYVADDLGLADPIGSRFELPPARRRPGHEKVMPDAFAYARWTDPHRADDQPTLVARAALRCGELAELNDAVSTRLTAGRFLGNLVHAFRFTSLRIPTNPDKARARFCR